MADCIENIVIPILPSDPCNGEKINSKCVVNDLAFPLLNLPANTQIDVILNAFYLALTSVNTRLNAQDILILDLQNKIALLK